jgi:hypothetical protein
MWIPVFRTGTWTDSQGRTRVWTEQDLDEIVRRYNPAEHEAPVVIGHPKDNAPAWGWVEALKRQGRVLYAKLRDLAPEFVQMLKKKMFKKRSISLYPDLTLRHVGFLGAQPPAVKGLPDVAFSEASVELELAEGELSGRGGILRALRSLLRDEVLQALEPSAEAEAELSQQALRDRELALRRRELEDFCQGLLREGRLTPGQLKAGLVQFMEHLAESSQVAEFAQGRKETPLEFFQRFLKTLPQVLYFQELLTQEEPSDRREALLRDYLRAHPGASYKEALVQVAARHPELFEAP